MGLPARALNEFGRNGERCWPPCFLHAERVVRAGMRAQEFYRRLRALRLRKRQARRKPRVLRAGGMKFTPRHPSRADLIKRPLRVDPELFEAACGDVSRPELVRSSHTALGAPQKCLRLPAPSNFRLAENPDQVLSFIYELRRQIFINNRFRSRGSKRRPSIYLDLDPISQIDLEGALLLAAEIDRVRLVIGFRPTMDDANWHPGVRALLYEFGFYDVVEADRVRGAEPIPDISQILKDSGIAVVRFKSDVEADGQKAKELRDDVYAMCEPPGDAKRPVYDVLFEAVLNAVQHAYPADIPGDGVPSVKRWWAGALVDQASGYLNLVVYDQGVGIPATLPRRSWWSLLSGKLPELNDAAVIAGGLEFGRSGATDDQGRGNGLHRICGLTDAFDAAEVLFTSLNGQVKYAKGGGVERETLNTRFCGTMIRWRAKVSTLEQAA